MVLLRIKASIHSFQEGKDGPVGQTNTASRIQDREPEMLWALLVFLFVSSNRVFLVMDCELCGGLELENKWLLRSP